MNTIPESRNARSRSALRRPGRRPGPHGLSLPLAPRHRAASVAPHKLVSAPYSSEPGNWRVSRPGSPLGATDISCRRTDNVVSIPLTFGVVSTDIVVSFNNRTHRTYRADRTGMLAYSTGAYSFGAGGRDNGR
jgi:hypothetical protein